jgi:hypothetical protein
VNEESFQKPRWLRDLLRFLPLKSQFVLSGNVRDMQVHEASPGEVTAVPLATAVLNDEFRKVGYARIIYYEPMSGFQSGAGAGSSAETDETLRSLGLTPTNGAALAGLDLLNTSLERFVGLDGPPAVLVIDFASRLIVRNEVLAPTEHQLFSRAVILSHSAPAGSNRVGPRFG